MVAIEPNDAMRKNGIIRTKRFNNVVWKEGTGEDTGEKNSIFDLVTFGSSFNVCDRTSALHETKRILKDKGWFACMWNHRDLTDNSQNHIEKIIASEIDNYEYGTRRKDQTKVINGSGFFKESIR